MQKGYKKVTDRWAVKVKGALAITDFVSEQKREALKERDKKFVYVLVNWSVRLSFKMYKEVLESNNLEIIYSENRKEDMIITYKLLAKKMRKYLTSKDENYKNLYKRYLAIVQKVKNNEIGWGIFVGIKR